MSRIAGLVCVLGVAFAALGCVVPMLGEAPALQPSTREEHAAVRIADGASAVLLEDRTTLSTTLAADGKPGISVEHVERYLILDERASDTLVPSASYDADYVLTSFDVWTVTRSGEKLPSDLRESWDRRGFSANVLYTDARRAAALPRGVVPGAVVHVRTVHQQSHARFIPHFQLTDEFPALRREVIGRGAAAAELAMVRMPEGDEVERDADGVLRVVIENVPAVRGAPGAPPPSRYLPFVAASLRRAPAGAGSAYFRTWPDVATFYRKLVRKNLEPDAAVRALAATIAARAGTDPEARIRAAAHWVRTHLRYVAIEAGIHAVKPRPVPQVLRKRYGDCKELTALLVALLRLMDVEAHPFLVPVGAAMSLPREVPGMQWFNHAIVAIPGKDGYRFIDPTFAAGDTWSLPWSEQGVEGLLIHEASEILRTPRDKANANSENVHIRTEVRADGSATIEVEKVLGGLKAVEVRDHARFGRPGEGRGHRRAMLHSRYGTSELELTSERGLDTASPALDGSATVSFRVTAPRFVIPTGARWLLYPEFLGTSTSEGGDFLGDSVRTAPVDLGPAEVLDLDVTLTLPPGAAIDLLPDPIVLERPFGRISAQFSRSAPNQIRYVRHLEMRGGTAPASDGADVLAFRQAVAAAMSAPAVVLAPKGGKL